MTQLRQQQPQLAARHAQVVVVTFQAGPVVATYARNTKLQFPILVDTQLQLYRAYGMDRARWRDLLGWDVWRVYFRLMARGGVPRWSRADMAQRGGDVLVDPGGQVRYHHIGLGPADRPSAESLVERIPLPS